MRPQLILNSQLVKVNKFDFKITQDNVYCLITLYREFAQIYKVKKIDEIFKKINYLMLRADFFNPVNYSLYFHFDDINELIQFTNFCMTAKSYQSDENIRVLINLFNTYLLRLKYKIKYNEI